MKKPIKFKIKKKIRGQLGRAGSIKTAHGTIKTPAFVTVGTKATVKSLTPEMVAGLGAQVVLGNTYHLHLQPGEDRVAQAGGIGKFMNWKGPTMTDSGGFQVFSLGAAFGQNITKVTEEKDPEILLEEFTETTRKTRGQVVENFKPAKVKEEGVYFRSHIDGSAHFFSPEKSIEIQNKIGADMIFAFDECTSPNESEHYQRHEHLRKKSAEVIGAMDFDGFGIGGSFQKTDMGDAVKWVNEILPEEKPRHLLGIGEPEDLFMAIENGCDLFDCVAPTRIARNGQVYTSGGKINLRRSQFQDDLDPIEKDCKCYTCKNYSKSYIAHLFRADEMLAATLASVHNLYFIINLVKDIRRSIMKGNFEKFRNRFLDEYKKK
jgi:queuine tRNA-ribosyltransferase